MNSFANIIASIRPQDYLDILLVTYCVYRLLLLIKGTHAVQMLMGLAILGAAFALSIQSELYTMNWLLSNVFDYLVIIVIVLFQDDLRRALAHVGRAKWFSSSNIEEEREIIDEIAKAACKMAKEKIGALIVIERETGLKNFIDTGSKIDSKVRNELFYSIFTKQSPIHDGAIIISNGRMAAAGCFLPLSKNPDLNKNLGTRHRAAIGITEDTDAVVVIVSEEAGAAHIVKSGKITSNLNEEEIRSHLSVILNIVASSGDKMRKGRAHV